MNIRARTPDVTFLAAVTLVTFVQVRYWDIAWRFGGRRSAEYLFRDLAGWILRAVEPTAGLEDVETLRYFNLFTDTLAISAFSLPALAVLLYGRTRIPRLTSAILRVGVAAYLAWLLVLTPHHDVLR